MLRTLQATRYAVPLREGGSLPAVLEASEGGTSEFFVTKFRGAGQGARALIAELVVALLARHVGLPVPEPALILLAEGFGRTERDQEIQDVLKASVGVNVGIGFLDGAFNFNPVSCSELVSPDLAADIVWLDAFTTNVDRTARNPNLMIHERKLWLIDHGAALYFHHDWDNVTADRIANPFQPIAQHVLLSSAGDIEAAHDRMGKKLDESVFEAIVRSVPDQLLMDAPVGTKPAFDSADKNREAYVRYLSGRLAGEPAFVAEAERARRVAATAPTERLTYRR